MTPHIERLERLEALLRTIGDVSLHEDAEIVFGLTKSQVTDLFSNNDGSEPFCTDVADRIRAFLDEAKA